MSQTPPTSTSAPQSPATRWFVAAGPYSDDDLVSEVAKGRVQSRTKLWRKGQEDWIHSSQIAELAHVRERGLLQAELVSNLPPAIVGESVYVNPTVQAAQTAQAMHTAPKAPPLQSAAADPPPKIAMSQAPPVSTSATRWFVADGPYSDDDLVNEVAEGRVQSRTRLWRKGQEGWIHSSQIAELAHVRERGLLQAELVSNSPPAIVGESVYSDLAVLAVPAVQAAPVIPRAPPLQSVAAALPPPLPAQPAVKSPVATQSLPETVFLSPKQATPVPIRMKTVHVVDDACGAVENLFPGNQRVMGAVKSIRSAMCRDLMTGNGFGLDKGIEALGAFVQGHVSSPDAVAEAKGEPSLPVQALMSLKRLHESAAKQVKNLNRSNMLADRMTTFLGVNSRPAWGLPVFLIR